jgi:hypothetical protein
LDERRGIKNTPADNPKVHPLVMPAEQRGQHGIRKIPVTMVGFLGTTKGYHDEKNCFSGIENMIAIPGPDDHQLTGTKA